MLQQSQAKNNDKDIEEKVNEIALNCVTDLLAEYKGKYLPLSRSPVSASTFKREWPIS